MNISNANKISVNFSALYKSKDVLSLVSGYEYKGASTIPQTIKSLTGIDLYSDEFHKVICDAPTFLCAVMSIEQTCRDELIRQNPELKETDESFVCDLHLKKGRKAQDEWFKSQLKKMPKEININPFSINVSELRKNYKDFIEILEKIF